MASRIFTTYAVQIHPLSKSKFYLYFPRLDSTKGSFLSWAKVETKSTELSKQWDVCSIRCCVEDQRRPLSNWLSDMSSLHSVWDVLWCLKQENKALKRFLSFLSSLFYTYERMFMMCFCVVLFFSVCMWIDLISTSLRQRHERKMQNDFYLCFFPVTKKLVWCVKSYFLLQNYQCISPCGVIWNVLFECFGMC